MSISPILKSYLVETFPLEKITTCVLFLLMLIYLFIKISVRYTKIKSRFSRSVVKYYVIPSCCLALAGMARQPKGASQQEKIT